MPIQIEIPPPLREQAGGSLRVATNGDTVKDVLADLVRQAGDRMTILAAGGVRAHNARAIIDRTGVREIHLRAMRERAGRPPSTSREEVAAVLRAVGKTA